MDENNSNKIIEIPLPYRNIFDFENLNEVQSILFEKLLYLNNSIIISAPTGSGKTTLFELAIINLLQTADKFAKVVYIAPVKALCSERLFDWQSKFSNVNESCIEITGDTSDTVDLRDLDAFRIIITTPEKWDSITRKPDLNFLSKIKLILIDEIHLLGDAKRGWVLENLLTRMKILSWKSNALIRFIAVSATLPNIEDVGTWLQADTASFSEDYRPIKVQKIVNGYKCEYNWSPYKFDMSLNYKLKELIDQYSHNRPTLIFCTTRKSIEQTINVLMLQKVRAYSFEQQIEIDQFVNVLLDEKLKVYVRNGIGFHHAGMMHSDKFNVELMFRNGLLPILLTTSTLSMGVNLPAHLVIIKSTEIYTPEGYQRYTNIELTQMIGRAGRPQFDKTATAIVMTKQNDKEYFKKILLSEQTIESRLFMNLGEVLNTEICGKNITSLTGLLEWVRLTFFYVRIFKNPEYYSFKINEKIDDKLNEICLKEIDKLKTSQLVKVNDGNDRNIDEQYYPTDIGKLTAKYCLSINSALTFSKLNGNESLEKLLEHICSLNEFNEIKLRMSDKKILNELNQSKVNVTTRFKIPGRITSRYLKVYCIIQAVFGCLPLMDSSLKQDALKIFKASERVIKCLMELVMLKKQNYFMTLVNTMVLYQCFNVQIWENSPFLSKQIEGIGPSFSKKLALANYTTFKSLKTLQPRDIERICGRNPPFGDKIATLLKQLPMYEINLNYVDNYLCIIVADKNENSNLNVQMNLMIGDSLNNILDIVKLSDKILKKHHGTFEHRLKLSSDFVYLYLICENWVGFDVEKHLKICYDHEERITRIEDVSKTNVLQTTINNYFKISKFNNHDKKEKSSLENIMSNNDKKQLKRKSSNEILKANKKVGRVNDSKMSNAKLKNFFESTKINKESNDSFLKKKKLTPGSGINDKNKKINEHTINKYFHERFDEVEKNKNDEKNVEFKLNANETNDLNDNLKVKCQKSFDNKQMNLKRNLNESFLTDYKTLKDNIKISFDEDCTNLNKNFEDDITPSLNNVRIEQLNMKKFLFNKEQLKNKINDLNVVCLSETNKERIDNEINETNDNLNVKCLELFSNKQMNSNESFMKDCERNNLKISLSPSKNFEVGVSTLNNDSVSLKRKQSNINKLFDKKQINKKIKGLNVTCLNESNKERIFKEQFNEIDKNGVSNNLNLINFNGKNEVNCSNNSGMSIQTNFEEDNQDSNLKETIKIDHEMIDINNCQNTTQISSNCVDIKQVLNKIKFGIYEIENRKNGYNLNAIMNSKIDDKIMKGCNYKHGCNQLKKIVKNELGGENPINFKEYKKIENHRIRDNPNVNFNLYNKFDEVNDINSYDFDEKTFERNRVHPNDRLSMNSRLISIEKNPETNYERCNTINNYQIRNDINEKTRSEIYENNINDYFNNFDNTQKLQNYPNDIFSMNPIHKSYGNNFGRNDKLNNRNFSLTNDFNQFRNYHLDNVNLIKHLNDSMDTKNKVNFKITIFEKDKTTNDLNKRRINFETNDGKSNDILDTNKNLEIYPNVNNMIPFNSEVVNLSDKRQILNLNNIDNNHLKKFAGNDVIDKNIMSNLKIFSEEDRKQQNLKNGTSEVNEIGFNFNETRCFKSWNDKQKSDMNKVTHGNKINLMNFNGVKNFGGLKQENFKNEVKNYSITSKKNYFEDKTQLNFNNPNEVANNGVVLNSNDTNEANDLNKNQSFKTALKSNFTSNKCFNDWNDPNEAIDKNNNLFNSKICFDEIKHFKDWNDRQYYGSEVNRDPFRTDEVKHLKCEGIDFKTLNSNKISKNFFHRSFENCQNFECLLKPIEKDKFERKINNKKLNVINNFLPKPY